MRYKKYDSHLLNSIDEFLFGYRIKCDSCGREFLTTNLLRAVYTIKYCSNCYKEDSND